MLTEKPINPDDLDHAVRPGDDFFGYVNNIWIRKNPIPANEARWGTFYVLRYEVEEQIKKIFEGLVATPAGKLDDSGKKVKYFYESGMDVDHVNAEGDAPLAPLLNAVNGIHDVNDLVRTIGFLHRRGIGVFWAPSPEPDAKSSDRTALYFSQAGLSLPDRDYYVNADEKSVAIRKRYADYAALMLAHSSIAADAQQFSKINDIEKTLAKHSMTRVELRDFEKQYNKMSWEELSKRAPHIDWNIYCEAIAIRKPEFVIVCQPEFMAAVSELFQSVPLESLKAYLRWQVLNAMSNFLSEDFAHRSFEFYGKTFGGATEIKPRWRRVLNVVNGMLDQAVAKLYVERHFSAAAKTRVNQLVDHLTEAYRARIKRLDWMSDATKEKALTKLNAISRKLGYPDVWRDISALTIVPGAYLENRLNAHIFEFDRQMKKIGKPVDRSEWLISPQTVNAFYLGLQNEIDFPAAILQPPFFYPDGDDAVNFGGIGMAIGHELTHGFDDEGSRFDANGNLTNWWTEDDRARFDKLTARLAAQFDAYELLPGLRVNGKLTLGENIADLGGLLIAYDGLTLALKENPVGAIDGFTPFERFFISYAITERSVAREEALRTQVQTDPHTPAPYRVNGPLPNMDEFYEAFDCKPGDALWRDPKDRVKIW